MIYGVVETLAVISGATYGAILARQHQMDFVGVFSLGLIVAFGGGTLRDLFLDRHPLFWIEQSHYPLIVFLLTFAFSWLKRIPRWLEMLLMFSDAMGLGLFSIVGAQAALEFGTTYFIASLMGVITGTFGGVIGDIVCNKVPSLFGTAPLYASCSFVGCWLFFLLRSGNLNQTIVVSVSVSFIVIFRLIAIRYHWSLPTVENR